MERARFGELLRSFARSRSRRSALGALAAAGGMALLPDAAGARKRQRKHKKKKLTFNAFGCVNVGGLCKNAGHCCSGICQGKQGQKRCHAHDVSTCTGQDSCTGETAQCTTTDGVGGACFVTTGNAGHCSAAGLCFACTKDADCLPICGAGAACIVCEDPMCAAQGIETNCAGTFNDACFLA